MLVICLKKRVQNKKSCSFSEWSLRGIKNIKNQGRPIQLVVFIISSSFYSQLPSLTLNPLVSHRRDIFRVASLWGVREETTERHIVYCTAECFQLANCCVVSHSMSTSVLADCLQVRAQSAVGAFCGSLALTLPGADISTRQEPTLTMESEFGLHVGYRSFSLFPSAAACFTWEVTAVYPQFQCTELRSRVYLQNTQDLFP